MDPILQKRLIGAVILIVAAIVFVPMLLDGPGGAGSETVDLGIPAPGADGIRTEIIPLDAPLAAPPLADEGDAQPLRSMAPALDPATVSSLADALDREAAAPGPIAAPPADPAIEPAPTVVAAPLVNSEHAADTSGRWHVTLGSYANADNARKLVTDMLAAGLPARAEAVSLGGKPAQRVRIGPYADRVRAEQARLAVAARRRDVTPALVQDDNAERAPAQPAPDDVAVAPAAVAGDPVTAPVAAAPVLRDTRGWVVQVGAYSQANEADAQAARLRTAGFTAFVDRLDAPRGTLHRVRIGPETQRAAAERLQVSVKQSLGIDGVVMRHP